jgi:hypothetical protein
MIYPGFTQTQVAKNALCAEKGRKFGKTDPNVASGMPLNQFIDESIISIFLRDTDRTIATKASHYIDM